MVPKKVRFIVDAGEPSSSSSSHLFHRRNYNESLEQKINELGDNLLIRHYILRIVCHQFGVPQSTTPYSNVQLVYTRIRLKAHIPQNTYNYVLFNCVCTSRCIEIVRDFWGIPIGSKSLLVSHAFILFMASRWISRSEASDIYPR